jgi:hypothetical protein
LSIAAGLTYSQVVNWTTNVRKRNLKATVEKGKKPHHFLDFLFLADNREKRNDVRVHPVRRGRPKNKTNNRKAKSVSSHSRAHERPNEILTANHSNDSDCTISVVSSGMQGLLMGTSTVLDTPKTDFVSIGHFNPMHFDAANSPTPRFYPGFTLPKVTPPRGFYRSSDQRTLNNSSLLIRPMMDLPPVTENLDWSRTENMVDDVAMLQEITKEGLVTTPQRRCSDDDITISWDGSRLIEQITNIFKEEEYMNQMDVEDFDDQSLSVDDIEDIMGMDDCGNVGDNDMMRMLEERIISDIRYEV